jgi:hypothetical protein
MGFTNIAQAGTNRQLARRQRAAERLQTQSKPYFTHYDSSAQQALENKLREFVGLCRKGGISQSNVYAAAVNVLAPVAKVMGASHHQHWIGRFNDEGLRAIFGKGRE